ncbi:hypothetical protein KIPB_008116, partial [Kipferlia bialata]
AVAESAPPSLVDAEGFPLADVDLYSVREARHKIAVLQTEFLDLMKKIESRMHSLHDLYRQEREAKEGNIDNK